MTSCELFALSIILPFICPFESGKCENEAKEAETFEYLGNKKFLHETKSSFYSF